MGKSTAKKAAAPRAEKVVEGVVIPDGVKVPEDHKAKQQSGVRTVEVRGQQWEIQEDVLDDFELLDDLNALDQRDDATRMPSVLRRLLGDAQWKRAMDLLRDPDTKRVGMQDGGEFVMELMGALNPNSSAS